MRTPPLHSPVKAPSPVAASQHPQSLSRTLDSPDELSLPMQRHDEKNVAANNTNNHVQRDPVLTPPSAQDLKAESYRDQPEQTMQTLETLKKKMEETIVSQQKQNLNSQHPTPQLRKDGHPSRTSSQSYNNNSNLASDNNSSSPDNSDGRIPSTDSVGSSHTVKAGEHKKAASHSAASNPSYPFPSMNLKLPREKPKRISVDEALPSTLISPPNASRSFDTIHSASSNNVPSLPEYNVPPSRSSFLPTGVAPPAEDPMYPSPNLYDITLALNADSGLDAWWPNAVQVLQKYYGAERATLAIPGDVTDLENVPWGQKAVFNINGLRKSSSAENLAEPTDQEDKRTPQGSPAQSKEKDDADSVQSKVTSPPLHTTRPELLSRHSFAGFAKTGNEDLLSNADVNPRTRPGGPLRTKSTVGPEEKLPKPGPLSDEKSGSDIKENQEEPSAPNKSVDFSEVQSNDRPIVVFPIPRALEVEPDPLIKRTGVVKLFGRTKPTALTREYSHVPPSHSDSAGTPAADDSAQTTSKSPGPLKEGVNSRSRSSSNLQPSTPKSKSEHGSKRQSAYISEDVPTAVTPASTRELYEEHEQTPPSPWSQSPAASPAPRSMPDNDPFFSHTIDEATFTTPPHMHDYSQEKPVRAIGVDRAKTLIHIPLVHSPSSRQTTSTPLRFPVAVISILTPIVPYPSNLMHSLTYLLPHLTTSYCLAQQYSQLEKQATSSANQRYSHILGLGGTFSDESSEMELVAGLSGHVNYTLGDDPRSSPSSSSNASQIRSGTAMIDSAALDLANIEIQEGLRRSPRQMDHYSSFEQVMGPGGSLSRSRSTQAIAKSRPLQAKLSTGKQSDADSQDSSSVTTPGQNSTRFPVGAIPGQGSRHASPTTIAGHITRDTPRPFSDYIAQLMLNSVPLHLFLAKPHTGEVIWTNAKFDAYRRSQPHEQQRLRDPWQNVHSFDRENLAKEWSKALRTGSQFTERVRVKRFNDESAYRWFIFRANPLISHVGELNYWIGSFLDVHEQHITEMKAAQEREIFATDAKYRALANSIPQVVFEAAEYRGLISANEQWQLYTGQTLDDALNLGFAKHVHRDDLEKCGMYSFSQSESGDRSALPSPLESETTSSVSSGKTARAGSFDGGHKFLRGVTPALQELVERGVVAIQQDENGRDSYSTEVRLRSRGGEFRWHLVRLVKVETTSFGSGEASWYGTCTDINDRKLLERELNKAMQKLNREMESKTKFFSNMSHEIRTPLNGILGTIPFILDTQLDNDQRRMLDTIQNSSNNLRGLVDNILDVSKVEAGKMNLVKAWFHVRSVVEDVIDTIASRAIDKGLELNYLFEVDVPSMVVGDRFRIRQVLINLMGNAVKFTSQGEIYTRCSVFQDPNANLSNTELLLNFEVTDTGKGFSATDAVRLMQRFSQIEGTSSQQHTGSGLGLFLSKQLVEMHGGRLTPEGREGQGAKFSFFVKVDVPTTQSPEEEAPTEGTHSRSVSTVHETPPAPPSPSKARLPLTSSDSHDSKNSDKQGSSMGLGSPAFPSTASSVRSTFDHRSDRSSSLSSALATPELVATQSSPAKSGLASVERETLSSLSGQDSAGTALTRKQSVRVPNSGPNHSVDPETAASEALSSPSSYAILIICPFDHAREAIKQHIEQVIPLDVASNIISVPDVDDWKDLMTTGSCPNLSHLILCIPDENEVREALQHVELLEKTAPSVVHIADMYQKRQVNSRFEELAASGRPMHLVPKPVKPSAFSNIFDPDNKRDLSKDRNQDMAREVNNNFKTMSKIVKEVIGNKGYRILLVEDDETNRGVMLKYLDKVKLASETAANGQECLEMVFSKEPGYYSLIICDIQMPVKNGYETCQEIRAWEANNHFPQIPIMALSANAMMEQIDDAARAGFNDYVTKPIKHNELGKMMMALLDPSVPTGLLQDGKPMRLAPPS